MKKTLSVVEDERKIGLRNVFGDRDSRKEGTLLYWLKDYEVVSLDSDNFIYVVNFQERFPMDWERLQEGWVPANGESNATSYLAP